MLITTCTHCLARFKVTPQQLNAKQGQVRCGKCSKIFSGFEALERFPDDDTGARLLAARDAAAEKVEPPPPAIAALEDLPDDEAPEIETLDAVPAARAALSEAPPTPPPPAYVEEPAATSTSPGVRRAAPRKPVIEYAETDPAPRRRLSLAWTFGAVLLALVLALEVTYALRGTLAQRYPAVRPWLESACAHAGCTVPWPRDERLLKLEDSELLEIPGRPQEIALGARIRNLAPFAQAYPHIELTLTDVTGQATSRRVLRPPEYAGRTLEPGDVLAAGGELAIQLRLETPRVKATGYQLLLFYP
jgi:predicted Zn finger-like uncharacterized protein